MLESILSVLTIILIIFTIIIILLIIIITNHGYLLNFQCRRLPIIDKLVHLCDAYATSIPEGYSNPYEIYGKLGKSNLLLYMPYIPNSAWSSVAFVRYGAKGFDESGEKILLPVEELKQSLDKEVVSEFQGEFVRRLAADLGCSVYEVKGRLLG